MSDWKSRAIPLAVVLVLSFAASDPTGGAGLQADILTIASLGCHPLSVVTGLTVQDTMGVEAVLPIDAGWVADQARALLEDVPVAAFKFGMLGSVEAIAVIAEIVNIGTLFAFMIVCAGVIVMLLEPFAPEGRKSRLGQIAVLATAVATNVKRFADWLNGVPLAPTRQAAHLRAA